MVRRFVWLGCGMVGMAVWAGCTQPVSQAFAPTPTATPVPRDYPFITEPALPADMRLIPKIDEAIVPGGNGRSIPLYEGFLSSGTDSKPLSFYIFQADDATRSLAATPITNLNRATAAWALYRRDGSQLSGQPLILSAVPGEPGYFPYVQVHRVTVPDSVQPNQIRDHRTILRGISTPGSGFTEVVPATAVNTVIVGENAMLQGNETAKPTLGWFDGRRAYYHTFDTQPLRNDGTVVMNPMWAPQPGLVGRPANYDRARELPTIVPFFHQTAESKVLTDAIADVTAPSLVPTVPSPAPGPSPSATAVPALDAVAAPSIDSATYSGMKALTYFPASAGYAFRSITTKSAIPDFANLPRPRYWLNAPASQTLRK
ncbi:MAG: hypothetical protein H7338_07205 [Candidatus Sericytochromatia bacterium]|nr:hypothetical protein [Candidatus Sericytochromatia bacterium]